MRNAALTLGIIAGVLGMFVGLFSFVWTDIVAAHPEAGEVFGMFDNPALVRVVSIVGPLLAIAGGAMAKMRALWGGIALLASAGLMLMAFGFTGATMFSVSFAAVGGILALAAGKPDEAKAHF
ncbi:MAG: hypothetical protein JKX69_15975 [Rhodobacteraceae bacterium]|nr:hypothetical protein [Paracoccaceae bacterium]